MDTYTIHDIATILQLDQSVKNDLQENFDRFDENAKCEIIKILWDGLHELKKRMAQLKYEQLLEEVGEGKRQLTTDLYQEAVKMVWQEFDDILAGKNKDVEKIEQIRSNLINLPNFSSSQKP